MSPTPRQTRLPWAGLLALAAAIFVSTTAEFLPIGLIPFIANDYGLPAGVVGQLISAFAATVVVTAIPVAMLTRKVPRKTIVLATFAMIGLAGLLAACAPTFPLLMVARVLGAMAHGLFWSAVFAYAAHLVPATQLGRATAITTIGVALAGIVGVPLGVTVAQIWGWRVAFAMIAILALVIGAVVAVKLPAIAYRVELPTDVPSTPSTREPGSHGMWLVCLVMALVAVGLTTFSTYVAVWLTSAASVPIEHLPIVLLLQGVVGAVATLLKGRQSDHRPRFVVVGSLMLTLVGYVTLILTAPVQSTPLVVTSLLIWAAAFAGVPNFLQVRSMQVASPRQRNLASALQATALNIGVGAGAIVGGITLDSLGAAALPWVGGGIIALATAVIIALERFLPPTGDGRTA